jgi:putative OPT family oligopeptide transporter
MPEVMDRVSPVEEFEVAPPIPFKPYIPPQARLRELTILPIIIGTVLGMIFGASSLYLVLKVGLTVSASIPVAVISISLFALLSKLGTRNATILENNIVQTTGSAGESIAFGVGVTMPAIMILGFDLEFTRVMLVAVLGGLLGILMMIPLRRALIVQQHGTLKYPEGTACAEVLKAGASEESRQAAAKGGTIEEKGHTSAKTIFSGFGIGFVYYAVMKALSAWKDTPEKIFGAPFKMGSISMELNPALLGVGYIIGPRIASIMCAGGVLAYLVLIPAIRFFGEAATGVIPPGTVPISEMDPNAIRGAYVLYIGAGAVAAGGIISLFRSLPVIWHGLKGGIRDLRGGTAASDLAPRTDQDIPMKYVLGGIIVLVIAILAARSLHMNLLGAILIILFGFLFVTVSSRLTGEIGSSSNPISGMTVATLLLTCLVFLIVGWTGPAYYVTALSVGAIVCIAASNGGTTSQDLKTGFLVGATPKYQQIAILIGALGSALILGPILLVLNDTASVYVPRITFQPVQPAISAPAEATSTLPPYQETIKPQGAGNYRIFKNDKGVISDLPAGEYLVNDAGQVVYKVQQNFPAELRANPSEFGKSEAIRGPQAAADRNAYRVWHKSDENNGPSGRYLVKDDGTPVYLVDPGINGIHRVRPDGSTVTKFDAPKATLMSYIIKGILNRQLPWGLVLLGVMIAIVLEMSGIPSLAFAVGVYLPLSSSSPIFVGGIIRWLVDKRIRAKLRHKNLTEEQLVAEGDKSHGVLMASGYIAGAAIAGIIYAIMTGVLTEKYSAIDAWQRAHNPFYFGPYADGLSLIPFAIVVAILLLTGRGALFAPPKEA